MIKNNIDIPTDPGVYLFKARGGVLYIGKAGNLKKRVEQYFQGRGHALARNLAEQADSVDYIVTESETDALHLEYNLVHHHRPPFNIRLKDDKRFPLVEVTTGGDNPFPGIYYTRQPTMGHFHAGPITDARKTRELIDIVTRVFRLRVCNDTRFKRGIPCLYYYIDRCWAPCAGKIDARRYGESVAGAVDLLKGKKKKTLETLAREMNRLAGALQFEDAQKIKEDMELVRQLVLGSYISQVRVAGADYDAVALHHDPGENDCSVMLFQVRRGLVKGREQFDFAAMGNDIEEILGDFLMSFYRPENLPGEVVVPFLPRGVQSLAEMFSRMVGRRVVIKVPVRGTRRKTLELALSNLNLHVSRGKYRQLGRRLRDALCLVHFPSHIEGFDISHLSERDRVGAAVVYERGKAVRRKYRNYIIKHAPPGDTAALEEVLERRFRQWDQRPAPPPDLLLIDGGKAQLGAALDVKKKLKLTSDVVSIAKGEERIYLEKGGSVVFPEGSPERFLLQNIRDEVHRRAVTHHRKRREKIGKSRTQ